MEATATQRRARVRLLASATLLASYLLIVVGGIARLTGAESGCSANWPLCDGGLAPWPLDGAVLADLSHRLLALVVSLLTAGLLIAGWRASQLGERRAYFILPLLASVLVSGQVALGAARVTMDLPAAITTMHLAAAQIQLGVMLLLTAISFGPEIARAVGRTAPGWGPSTSLGRLALVASGAIFALMLTGAYTALSPAAPACRDWPFCDGQVVPAGWSTVDIQLAHRWVAVIATIAVLGVMVRARRVRSDSPALVGLATAAGALMLAQIYVGAASAWMVLPTATGAAHLGVATLIWALLLGISVLDRMIPYGAVGAIEAVEAAEPSLVSAETRARWRRVASDYLTLTKPNVMILLLITTLCGMMIAKAGLPPLDMIFWTLLGGALSSGGAAAMNHYMDRDIDAIMKRTRKRPLPGKRIPPVHVPIFGITLTVLAVYLLAVFVNPLAAMLSLAGNLFYVLVYTKYLKRSTPQNIVIGGAAGAVPPMVGWAAVTGNVGLPALLLFAVVFYWTPPHFWALALFTSSDYAAAKVPMFPEVYGDAETRRHIFLYTVMLVITTLFFFPLRIMGPFYLLAALILGAIFLYKSWELTRHPDEQKPLARSLFFYSVWYLGLIFAAMVIDRVVWY